MPHTRAKVTRALLPRAWAPVHPPPKCLWRRHALCLKWLWQASKSAPSGPDDLRLFQVSFSSPASQSCLCFLRISNTQLPLTLPRVSASYVCGLTVAHTAINLGPVVYSLCIISAVFLYWQGSRFTSHTSNDMSLRLDTGSSCCFNSSFLFLFFSFLSLFSFLAFPSFSFAFINFHEKPLLLGKQVKIYLG